MAQMPPSPPEGRMGNSCVWIITGLFFLLIMAGGAFLVLYMTLPESDDTVWFPAAGILLIGIPWIFWLMTCFYRTMKIRRASSDHMPPMRVATIAPTPVTTTAAAAASDSPVNSPSGARKVRFGATSQEAEAVSAGTSGRMADGEGDGLNEASLTSHESERPLAFSMSGWVVFSTAARISCLMPRTTL